MDNSIKGAILQRDKETYAVVVRVPNGILRPEDLDAIAAAARRYSIPLIKITSAQRIALVGIKREDIEGIRQHFAAGLGLAEGRYVHYVQACPGKTFCKFGQQDSLGLAERLEALTAGKDGIVPAKTKIGISGCKLNCAESLLKDFGAFGTKEGWSVVIGGNSGGRPCIGQVIAENLGEEEVVPFFEKCFGVYSLLAREGERMPRLLQRIGIEEFKKALADAVRNS